MEIKTDLFLGDSKTMLKKLPDNSVDLIVTSPPYADQRKGTYGGIHPDKYVEWFLPVSEELLRVPFIDLSGRRNRTCSFAPDYLSKTLPLMPFLIVFFSPKEIVYLLK